MIQKMWYMCAREYYSARKNNEIRPFAATWMDLAIITLSEVGQKEKYKYHMILLTCGIQNMTHRSSHCGSAETNLCCHELQCRLQAWLRSCVAVAVVWASGSSSSLIPSLGTSICRGCGPKKKTINKINYNTHTHTHRSSLVVQQAKDPASSL